MEDDNRWPSTFSYVTGAAVSGIMVYTWLWVYKYENGDIYEGILF